MRVLLVLTMFYVGVAEPEALVTDLEKDTSLAECRERADAANARAAAKTGPVRDEKGREVSEVKAECIEVLDGESDTSALQRLRKGQ